MNGLNARKNPETVTAAPPRLFPIPPKGIWRIFTCLLILAAGCDFKMPNPPPDVLYKFDTIQVGWGPVFVTSADLNQDSLPDLIVANSKDHTLAVMTGNGEGHFHNKQTIPVPLEPTSIAVADLNHDDLPDVVFNSKGNDLFGVLMGMGKGKFLPLRKFQTGSVPLSIIIDDFNADSHPDVVVTLTFSKMEVHLGTGDGNFKMGDTYKTGSRSLSGVSGDFNNDGHKDLALAVHSSNASDIHVFAGHSDGTFQLVTRAAKNLRCLVLIKGDLNKDGIDDLIAASSQGDNMYWMPSRGDGTFEDGIPFSGGGGPISLASADFDADGQADIVVASSSFSLITRFPDGRFRFPVRDYVTGGTPLSLTTGDFNQDGLPDVAVVSNTEGTVEVFLGRGEFKG